MKKWNHDRKKNAAGCLIITLLWSIVVTLEISVIFNIVWYGWGGFGDISKEYTERGELGVTCVILFIPALAALFLIFYLVKACKQHLPRKKLLRQFILHFLCIACGTGLAFTPIYWKLYGICFGIVDFLIETFDWMTYPSAGSIDKMLLPLLQALVS